MGNLLNVLPYKIAYIYCHATNLYVQITIEKILSVIYISLLQS